jgi:glycosyltransferase involved in cell wall biosynthesis
MYSPRPPILLITENDPLSISTGGQVTFAKHLISAFGEDIAIASYCKDGSVPKKTWSLRDFNNKNHLYFNLGPSGKTHSRKPIVPARIRAYFCVRNSLHALRQKSFSGVIIDSPEVLFAISRHNWPSICYSFAGLNNPVAFSRYPLLRVLGGLFETYQVRVLKHMKPDLMIAAADDKAIRQFHARTNHLLDTDRFHKFPTRVDTNHFCPIDCLQARESLALSSTSTILLATGRIAWIKGWELLLNAFAIIKKSIPDATMIFVGDGEDRFKLSKMASDLDLLNDIRITGFVPHNLVVRYMNAADVCLVASHREGWSLAMCEMLACGKAIVSTDVSGARDMVHDGHNGFVVGNRNPIDYADAIFNTLKLEGAGEYSRQLSNVYSVKNLAKDLTRIWKALQ